MKTGKILLGAVVGIAAGAILGMLFAPEKGSRTRRKILDKGEDYADLLTEKVEDYLVTMKEKCENLKQSTEQLVSKSPMTKDEVNKVIS